MRDDTTRLMLSVSRCNVLSVFLPSAVRVIRNSSICVPIVPMLHRILLLYMDLGLRIL